MFSKISIIHIYIYVYKSFSTTLNKTWERTSKKKERRDGEIGDHKLNEMGALNMK